MSNTKRTRSFSPPEDRATVSSAISATQAAQSPASADSPLSTRDERPPHSWSGSPIDLWDRSGSPAHSPRVPRSRDYDSALDNSFDSPSRDHESDSPPSHSHSYPSPPWRSSYSPDHSGNATDHRTPVPWPWDSPIRSESPHMPQASGSRRLRSDKPLYSPPHHSPSPVYVSPIRGTSSPADYDSPTHPDSSWSYLRRRSPTSSPPRRSTDWTPLDPPESSYSPGRSGSPPWSPPSPRRDIPSPSRAHSPERGRPRSSSLKRSPAGKSAELPVRRKKVKFNDEIEKSS